MSNKFKTNGGWSAPEQRGMTAHEIRELRDAAPTAFRTTMQAAEMFALQTRHYEEMAATETNAELRAIYEALAEAGRRGDQIESFRLMQRMERFFFGVPVGEVRDE